MVVMDNENGNGKAKEAPLELGECDIDNETPLLADDSQQEKPADQAIGLPEEGNGKHIIKLNGDRNDGAGEKLVDTKVAIKDVPEVKFDLSTGDAKIDIEKVKTAFQGMGKEELMKFANDPFWIRMRWFLFISFWVIWFAMLAGAISIIVVAPKCSYPAPLVWWEQSPLYQVNVRSFKDGAEPQDGVGDLKGLLSKLNYIGDLGVKGITISSILKTSDAKIPEDSVENFQEIDPIFGSLGDFKALVTEIKSRGMHLIMSFIINHSSSKHQWFLKSERKEGPYKDYYIWAPSPSSGVTSDGNKIPPNNWLSVVGGSAWQWSDIRKEFYLHQFKSDQPDLNFHNSAVIEEINAILEFWLDLGVSGFQLEKSQYLLEDLDLRNETHGTKPGTTHDQYDFYGHHRTKDQPQLCDVLARFKNVVRNRTGDDGILTLSGQIPLDMLSECTGNRTSAVVDLPQINALAQLKPGFTGDDLRNKVQTWQNIVSEGTRVGWQLTSWSQSRTASRLSTDDVDGLTMVAMLLPGTPLTIYGEELGMEDSTTNNADLKGLPPMSWSNTSNAGFSDVSGQPIWLPLANNFDYANVITELEAPESSLKVYKALVEARNSPSIMYGTTDFNTTANGTVFAFASIKSGNPGYIVAFNTATYDVVADLTVINNVSGDLTVVIKSSNIRSQELDVKNKLPATAVPLPPKGALVLTFVPKKSD